MSNLSKNTEQKYLLDNVQYNAPVGWEDTTVEADYVNDNTQPSLTVSDFEFPLEARDSIFDWFHDGAKCFEGMPFELILYNNQSQQVSFKAFLDFYSNYEELINDGIINVNTLKEDSVDDLYSKLESLTYGYLESIGAVGSGNYVTAKYVVEKKFNLFEIIMASVMLYLMVKELAESIQNTANVIAEVAGLSLFVGTGSTALGAALLAILKALIIIAYTAALLIAVINLSKSLFEALVPPVKKHKTILLKEALTVVATHLGYSLVAPDSVLNEVYYLPSNPRLDDKKSNGFINFTNGTPTGIPNIQDYGYNCADMFNLAKTLIKGKIAVINNTIHLRTLNDPFWIQQSTWQLPDVLIESKKYNLSDLKSTKVYQFRVDQRDEWTIDNYEGTAYEVKTDVATYSNKKAVLLKGSEEVNFNVALGNRKDKLNAIENLLKELASVVDGVTSAFGGGTNFAGAINAAKGVLRQSENWHSVPKLLPLKGAKLPGNHRALFSAKTLYNSYLNYDSFIENGYRRQRAVYESVEIPFGIEDFKKLTSNSYFLFNGNTAKITNFTWTTGKDRANISFWVEEVYTTNLKETFIEPK